LQVFSDFFGGMSMSEIRQALANMLEVALTTPCEQFKQPVQRADIIYFCKKEELVEATYVLSQSKPGT
jgi:hypothetical protein